MYEFSQDVRRLTRRLEDADGKSKAAVEPSDALSSFFTRVRVMLFILLARHSGAVGDFVRSADDHGFIRIEAFNLEKV